MDGGDPLISLGEAQLGDLATGDLVAGSKTTITGADPNRLVTMVELLIKNAWDDQQRRAVWEAKEDEERRHRQNEADYHREMTRQRLERIADDVAGLGRDIAETRRLGQEARRWLIGLTLALVVVGAVVVAVVADRLGVMALALLTATVAARLGR